MQVDFPNSYLKRITKIVEKMHRGVGTVDRAALDAEDYEALLALHLAELKNRLKKDFPHKSVPLILFHYQVDLYRQIDRMPEMIYGASDPLDETFESTLEARSVLRYLLSKLTERDRKFLLLWANNKYNYTDAYRACRYKISYVQFVRRIKAACETCREIEI